ncbi:hypothetical protein ACQ4PT_052176 [Festuca glaucescens]
MWRLTTSEGGGPWLRSANGFLGRQVWEYDPDTGTPDERAEVDRLRADYTKHRFHRKESQDLLLRLQNEDGGWGKQVLGPSTMFGSCFNYASLVLLGEKPNDDNDSLAKGRSWILSHGSATAIPQWGKIWLSIIGVYEWSGNNPIIPELWLVPDFLPIHPGLREDLYNTAYEKVNWDKARHSCAKEDLHYPRSHVQDIVFGCLNNFVEPVLNCWPANKLRERALSNLMEHIHYEDETTNFVGKCPINKALNMICCWVENPNSDAFKQHLPRFYDYLWLSEDGMKAQVLDNMWVLSS